VWKKKIVRKDWLELKWFAPITKAANTLFVQECYELFNGQPGYGDLCSEKSFAQVSGSMNRDRKLCRMSSLSHYAMTARHPDLSKASFLKGAHSLVPVN